MFVFVNVAPRALALQSPQTNFVGVDTAQDDSEENRTSEESNGFLAHHLTTRSRCPLKLWHPAKASTCGCAGHKKIALREVARDRGVFARTAPAGVRTRRSCHIDGKDEFYH